MMTRARPLLGTIVAIRSDGPGAGIDRAFAAVERVQALMNFHSAHGDVARINRGAHRAPVSVDAWTYRVLTHALELSARTEGAFDVTVPGNGASYADVDLGEDRRVRLRRPARIDLGGIAKGFAVDMAVQALRESGASCGCVNAGGDLRMFGEPQPPVSVRLPGAPASSVCLPRVPQSAFATSASYFGSRVNDVGRQRRKRLDYSITIAAGSCMMADALTKAVALRGPLACLLGHFNAAAFAVDRHGRLYAPSG